ncbi:hypothetical protein DOZ91_23750 [Peribacillus frigoritolerans]|nr:hypothetical protein DOZ91_23750 [Peribacillus frigoritolerans]
MYYPKDQFLGLLIQFHYKEYYMKFTHKKNGNKVIPIFSREIISSRVLLKRIKKLPGLGIRPWPFLPISGQSDNDNLIEGLA